MEYVEIDCKCGERFKSRLAVEDKGGIPPVRVERALSACPKCGYQYVCQWEQQFPDRIIDLR